MFRVIPIQFARVPQTETYTQIFTFMDGMQVRAAENDKQDGPVNLAVRQNEKMDLVFNGLMGEENWQSIKDMYGLSSMRQELIEHKIEILGNMVFILYLDPVDQNNIVAEGHGRFYLVRKKYKEILLSGDFDVVSEPYSLEKARRTNYILAKVNLFVTRIPGQITHIHNTNLKYKIYLKNDFKSNEVFSIDYDRNHDVFMPNDVSGNALEEKDKIAIMKFNSVIGKRKISDTRGMMYLRNDYKD